MSTRVIGGIIHTYQRYDPKNFPSPTQPPPDLVSGAMEHMLAYGSMRELTDEELARAVQLDPSQIAGLGPSLEALMELLRERKRKILETYETKRVKKEAAGRFHDMAKSMQPPSKLAERFRQAVKEEQLYDIERLWYRVDDERSPFARQLVQLIDRLGDKYQVDELAAKYEFTGRTPMTVPKALEIKEELEEIDRLLQAAGRSGQDRADRRDRHGGPGRVRRAGRHGEAQRAGPHDRAVPQATWPSSRGWRRPPRATGSRPRPTGFSRAGCWSGFSATWQASRTGRHQGPILGEGAVELQQTKPYEFGDSLANMDIPGSLINAMLRDGPGLPVRHAAGGHRRPPHPQLAQVRHGRAPGHERLDALRRAVHQRQADGPGPGRPDPPRVSRRLAADSSRSTPSPSCGRRARSSRCMPKPVTVFDPVVRLQGRHERRAGQRDADPAALHEHPARPADRPAIAGRPGHAQPADHPHHRRPADGPFRGQGPLPALSARPRGPKRPRSAKASSAAAKGSRSTSSCCKAGGNRARTCSSPSSYRNRPRAACSSPPARTSTATWSGTT